MTLRKYLLLIIWSAAAIPFVAFIVLQAWIYNHDKDYRDIEKQLSAELVGREIESRIELFRRNIEFASQYLAEGETDPERLNEYLKGIAIQQPVILNIHYDNLKGQSIASYPTHNDQGEPNIGVDHTNREHWKRILGDSDKITQILQAVGVAEQPVASIIVPATNKKSKVVGYAVCALDMDKLVENVSTRLSQGNLDIWLFDDKGVPVYSNKTVSSLTPTLPETLVQRVNSNGGEWTEINRDDASGLVGYLLPLPRQDWVVGIFRKAIDEENNEGVIIYSSVILALIVFLLTLIVSS